MDMDTVSLKSLDRLLTHEVVLVDDVNKLFGKNNGVMAAVPSHPLMLMCANNLGKSSNLPLTMVKTGPIYLTANYLSMKDKTGIRVVKVPELKEYIDHQHHATWTKGSSWIKALDPERRKFMTIGEVPCPLRPFLKGKVGSALP